MTNVHVPGGDCTVAVRPTKSRGKGGVHAGHEHNFGHLSVFLVRVLVEFQHRDGRRHTEEYPMGEFPWIRKEVVHKITELDECLCKYAFLCVYNHRDGRGEITDTYCGWDDAYV